MSINLWVCKCQFFINLAVSYMPMNNKRTKHIWNILTYMHNLFCLVLCVSFSFYIFIISQDIAIVNTKFNGDCSQILCIIYHYLIYYELHNNVECTNPEYFLNVLMKVSKLPVINFFNIAVITFAFLTRTMQVKRPSIQTLQFAPVNMATGHQY